MVSAPVQGLFRLGCPSAVLRRVRTVIIDAFNSQALLIAGVHILDKVGEVFPACAEGYAPVTVVMPIVGFGVGTSLAHGDPSIVKGRMPLGGAVKFQQQTFRPFTVLSPVGVPHFRARSTKSRMFAVQHIVVNRVADLPLITALRTSQCVTLADTGHD
jgi:hypothetical protein